jgi:hypothetical protein
MHRITLTIAAVAALGLLPANAVAQDLRSPDARDSASVVSAAPAPSDLRSPDARDSARAVSGSSPAPDLSSPDARDSARNPVTTYAPGQPIRPTQPVVTADRGFDWGDAGLGAAGMLGLIAIVGGTLLVAGQRRRHRGVPIATS